MVTGEVTAMGEGSGEAVVMGRKATGNGSVSRVSEKRWTVLCGTLDSKRCMVTAEMSELPPKASARVVHYDAADSTPDNRHYTQVGTAMIDGVYAMIEVGQGLHEQIAAGAYRAYWDGVERVVLVRAEDLEGAQLVARRQDEPVTAQRPVAVLANLGRHLVTQDVPTTLSSRVPGDEGEAYTARFVEMVRANLRAREVHLSEQFVPSPGKMMLNPVRSIGHSVLHQSRVADDGRLWVTVEAPAELVEALAAGVLRLSPAMSLNVQRAEPAQDGDPRAPSRLCLPVLHGFRVVAASQSQASLDGAEPVVILDAPG